MTKIYPVVHFQSSGQTLAQAQVALEAGADGVFLISHDGHDKAVLQAAGHLRHKWGQVRTAAGEAPFIGVNLLHTNNPQALEYAAQLHLDGVWLDAPGVNSHGASPRTKRFGDDMHKHRGTSRPQLGPQRP